MPTSDESRPGNPPLRTVRAAADETPAQVCIPAPFATTVVPHPRRLQIDWLGDLNPGPIDIDFGHGAECSFVNLLKSKALVERAEYPNGVACGEAVLSPRDVLIFDTAEFRCVDGSSRVESPPSVSLCGEFLRRDDTWSQAGYIEMGNFVSHGDRQGFYNRATIFGDIFPNVNLIDQSIRFGAVDFMLRYSYLNLLAGQATSFQGIGARAGEEHDVTLGLNWQWNPMAAVRINYVRAHVNSIYSNASGDRQGLGIRFLFGY